MERKNQNKSNRQGRDKMIKAEMKANKKNKLITVVLLSKVNE